MRNRECGIMSGSMCFGFNSAIRIPNSAFGILFGLNSALHTPNSAFGIGG